MGVQKLILTSDFTEEFLLIGIHCSEEAYKVAFLLNQFADLKLKRRKLDLEYTTNGLDILFPLFDFEDEMRYISYDLVANKCVSKSVKTVSSGGLFGDENISETITTYLLPEYKKVDYLLKITTDAPSVAIKKIVTDINKIKQVISAYEIDTEQLKSKNNLIFE
ncbi:hypothetical protein SCB49_05385 [unidentified eubacterium SCB49]|nr:hypothetical protein SCB49_05385 [unidentified eubacterium SCB49]